MAKIAMSYTTVRQGVRHGHARTRHDGMLLTERLPAQAAKTASAAARSFAPPPVSAGTACCTKDSFSRWPTTCR
jgi:hypothetical protein